MGSVDLDNKVGLLGYRIQPVAVLVEWPACRSFTCWLPAGSYHAVLMIMQGFCLCTLSLFLNFSEELCWSLYGNCIFLFLSVSP